jgi:hypothetical protein
MEQLLSSFQQGNVILFVGAGVSMELGLPSWNKLIDKIATELDYDPEIYRTLGDNYALAEYYRIKKGNIGQLRSWMDREWHSPNILIEKSIIHERIVKAGFPIIYTTNYDRWLENAHEYHGRPFAKIASVSDLAGATTGCTQIVKFHGDFDDDSSIVLGESSYFERLDFESPLDIKLRADVLGKSVLFIGYQLADINLRLLFYKLSKLWMNRSGGPRPRSYIFSPRPNAIQEAILDQWGIEVISSEFDEPGQALADFLEIFKRI